MILVLWKKIFCGLLITMAVITLLPTRWLAMISPVSNHGKITLEDKANHNEKFTVEEHIQITPTHRTVTRTHKDIDGNIVQQEAVTNIQPTLDVLLEGYPILAHGVWIMRGLDLPTSTLEWLILKREAPTSATRAWLMWAMVGCAFASYTFWAARARYIRPISTALWTIGTFLGPLFVIPFFIQFRPQGELFPCRSCGRRVLMSLHQCPICHTQGGNHP